jgi:hypothetical protein
LLGERAPVGASTVARLKEKWEAEHEAWQAQPLDDSEVVYLWADGINVKVGKMKSTVVYDYKGQVVLPSCAVCGGSCAVDSSWLYWQHRPERTCTELAAVAAELVASKARTCEEWTDWTRRAARRLDQTLWNSPVKNVTNRLIAAAIQFICRHADGDDILDLCRAVETHGPAEGEAARILRAGRPDDKEWPRWAWPEACWVRCEKHRTWCAVGLYKDIHGYREGKRRILGAHFIAGRSRSCEEFRARQMAAVKTICAMRFVPTDRSGRWVRRDQAEEKKIMLAYAAAIWSGLALALSPWETVAASMLSRGSGS